LANHIVIFKHTIEPSEYRAVTLEINGGPHPLLADSRKIN